jgi:DNA (cytosine-5)-methyltransferase 1
MPYRDVRIFSFFSGAGFLDLGFETAGFPIHYVNEVHKPFLRAYMYARDKMGIDGPKAGIYQGSIVDLTFGKGKVRLSELVKDARRQCDVVGFIGGPPCPDFSVGGKNRGRYGKNGKLSRSYVEVICQQEPDFFLFENVEGLWRTKKHRAFFEELKRLLHRCGYVTTQRRINSLEYGSPQDRERIILIGFHGRLLRRLGISEGVLGFELADGLFPWTRYANRSKEDVLLAPWPERDPFVEDSERPCPEGIIKELTVAHWFEKNQVANHPNQEHHFKPRAGIKRFRSICEGDVSRKSFKRLHRWRYSPTAAYGNNEVHLHPYKARRLTVAEALAIQSLPREFELPPEMTLSDMFKTIGNGVPYLAAQGLALAIGDFLSGRVGHERSLGGYSENHRGASEGTAVYIR